MATTRGQWASPERTIVWTEPPPKTIPTTSRAPPPHNSSNSTTTSKVPVVYYLSRNGQLDHPHFMEVPLSDPARGLCLRDVLARLTALRGVAMPAQYSWSSKRSYRNGYVWHDLTADDLVHPAHGNEYVLKGSELLLRLISSPRPRDASATTSSSSSSSAGCQMQQDSSRGRLGRAAARQGRKNWNSFDLGEYRVAVRDADDDLCAADAATQTEDHRRARRPRIPAEPTETELGIDEISPPPSSSSPDTLETLIKKDARVAAAATTDGSQSASRAAEEVVGVIAGGRMRASAVLMQLISCGSVTVKPSPPRRFPRGRSDLSYTAADDGSLSTVSSNINMEREYFSGSLVETTTTSIRGGHAELKRTSSYNADRCSSRGAAFTTQEEEGVVRPTRCIPRKYSKPPSPINHQD